MRKEREDEKRESVKKERECEEEERGGGKKERGSRTERVRKEEKG